MNSMPATVFSATPAQPPAAGLVAPVDDANARLVELVRPLAWRHPTPAPRYDLIVLGGGTAGLVSAMGAAGLGARVALVERHLLGGDCLNTGCVPSKALIRSARVVAEARRAAALGVTTGEIRVDFPAVMRRMRERRASIAANDSAERLRKAGVDVFFGAATFADERTIAVDDRRLTFRRAIIATGSRPAAPAVAGLESVPYLTSETIFSLTELPRHLLVVGAGPIGCELAQAFARFGSRVTVFGRPSQVLRREDADAAAIVQSALEADGVRFELGVRLERVEPAPAGLQVHFSRHDAVGRERMSGDAILVAAGRSPNVEGLRLDAAGIDSTPQGVTVDDRLRTSNRRVFASGDVCSRYKFTHAADALSRIAIQNALFFGRKKASALVVPWVTYTDPELAHVGASTRDVERSAGRLQTIDVPLADVDRAVLDDRTDGFIRVHHERGRIRGCTIVAVHAGEMVGEVAYAMTHGGGLTALSSTIHPYPTHGEALRKAGDVYRRQALTPQIRSWFQRYFRWRG